MPTAVPCSARMASAARRPSSVWVGGIRMSTIATSGRCSRTAASSSSAVQAWATTLNPASTSRRAMPSRSSTESSARTIRRRHDASASARIAAPDSSSLRMNPSAPLVASRPPNSVASRLEVSTTKRSAGRRPPARGRHRTLRCPAARCRAGRGPGCRFRGGRGPAPSPASPTTSKPSASSRARAWARKRAWSSTMRIRDHATRSCHAIAARSTGLARKPRARPSECGRAIGSRRPAG